jgi:hypothetical protein
MGSNHVSSAGNSSEHAGAKGVQYGTTGGQLIIVKPKPARFIMMGSCGPTLAHA